MSEAPQRKRRITRACDQCHRSNTKCVPSEHTSVCKTCSEFGSECTFQRPVRRRGPRKDSDSTPRGRKDDTTPAEWLYHELASAEMVAELVEAYHSIVYPIFPLFHWPTFLARVRAREYTTDRAFFITTMAVCAIVSARFRNGVSPPGFTFLLTAPSEAFAKAATDAFPTRLTDAKGFEYMRAKALLAILYIQYGSVMEHRTHLGEYIVLVSNNGFYDETRWDDGLREPELQERRRVFWSTYTLEVYSAITWGGIVRLRENQSNVLYPAEADDDHVTAAGIIPTSLSYVSFLRGWNFTTTMYRVLEHLVDQLRMVRRTSADSVGDLFRPLHSSSKQVLDRLMLEYSHLPDVFKVAQAMTGDVRIDRFGFQAANIIITFQTVKLALAAAEDIGAEQRCTFARELISALAAIPTAYIAAVSRPILHHLASCGYLLAGVVNRPLSQSALIQVREVLLAMSSLLSGLETTLGFPSDISTNLRTHVIKIDEVLVQAGSMMYGNQSISTPLPLPVMDNAPTMPTDLAIQLPYDHRLQLQTDLTEGWLTEVMGVDLTDFGNGLMDFGPADTITDDLAWLLGPSDPYTG